MGPGSLWHSFKVRMTEILEPCMLVHRARRDAGPMHLYSDTVMTRKACSQCVRHLVSYVFCIVVC